MAGVDAAPVLEPTEHVFDFVTLTVDDAVVRDCRLAVAFDGIHGVMPGSDNALQARARSVPSASDRICQNFVARRSDRIRWR